jgi:crotonobetainyl-CoA hydratase
MRRHAAYRACIDSLDAREGPRAFAEKRDPVWRGR